MLLAVGFDVTARPSIPASALVLVSFLLTTLPFTLRATRKDAIVGLLSPILLAARSCAQLLGVAAGVIYAARRKPAGEGQIRSQLQNAEARSTLAVPPNDI